MAGRFLRRPHKRATRTESSILKIPLVRSSQRMAVPCACGDASNSFKNCHKWMWDDWAPFFCKCEWCFFGVFAFVVGVDEVDDVSPSFTESNDFGTFKSISIAFSEPSSKSCKQKTFNKNSIDALEWWITIADIAIIVEHLVPQWRLRGGSCRWAGCWWRQYIVINMWRINESRFPYLQLCMQYAADLSEWMNGNQLKSCWRKSLRQFTCGARWVKSSSLNIANIWPFSVKARSLLSIGSSLNCLTVELIHNWTCCSVHSWGSGEIFRALQVASTSCFACWRARQMTGSMSPCWVKPPNRDSSANGFRLCLRWNDVSCRNSRKTWWSCCFCSRWFSNRYLMSIEFSAQFGLKMVWGEYDCSFHSSTL